MSICFFREGNIGLSGTVTISTGTASLGNTGNIVLSTGQSSAGRPGNIIMLTGTSSTGNGADIFLVAGNANGKDAFGGRLFMGGGQSLLGSGFHPHLFFVYPFRSYFSFLPPPPSLFTLITLVNLSHLVVVLFS